MRLLVTLVLVGFFNLGSSHWIVPVVSNANFVAPYGYVVHHEVPDFVQPDVSQHAVSRETLEEQSGEGFLQQIPDISVEQAHLNPETPSHRQPQPDQTPNVIFNGPQPDGSYDFSYQLDDQSRSEKSDAQGNVQGTYSYTGADGNQVQISYSAGANKGYVPVGEGLLPPPDPSSHGDEWEGQNPQVPHVPQVPDPVDDSQQHIPPNKGSVPQKPPHGQEEEEEHHGGMPYSYNYDAGLSSKTETADDQGNVEGSYTYIDGAGVKRTVTYTVKGNEGFVAKGDIHPDPGTEDGGRGDVPPTGGQKPRIPPTKGQRPIPPTEGQRPVQPEIPPPAKGGRPRPPPTKGGGRPQPPASKGASGWDKYPLGR